MIMMCLFGEISFPLIFIVLLFNIAKLLEVFEFIAFYAHIAIVK